jgi:CheY-like chemotaxis protein
VAELKSPSVLVIDDEAAVAAYIGAMLEKLDCRLAGLACEWDTARNSIRDEQIDAAILDARLQGLATHELAASLRARGIPFALSIADSEERADGYGDVPVLVKPFAIDALRQALASLKS